MGEFRMPSLGADMDRGTLVEWHVAVGDAVRRGDIVAAVETDKSVIDVEVFESGVVEELLVEPGTGVEVGTPLARIGAGEQGAGDAPDAADGSDAQEVDRSPSTSPPRSSTALPTPAPARHREHASGPTGVGPTHHHAGRVLSPLVRHLAERRGLDAGRIEGTGPGGRVTREDVEAADRRLSRSSPPATPRSSPPATPRARRRAAELGVDLHDVTGSGPHGAVRERDLPTESPAERAPAPPPARSGGDARRAAITRTMERSNLEIPHYHLSTTVDLGALVAWLEERNRSRPPDRRVLPAAALLRATALAAAQVPSLNGTWTDGAPALSAEVHLGVMVSLRGGGLLVPVIHDADRRSTDEIMAALSELVQRARRGALRSSELAGATISVTNLGDRGVDEVHGVIHPPELALVGIGRIALRALVVDGAVVARPSVVVTLAADHRASDGRTGSAFLRRMERLLAQPARLEDRPDEERADQERPDHEEELT